MVRRKERADISEGGHGYEDSPYRDKWYNLKRQFFLMANNTSYKDFSGLDGVPEQ